MIFARPEDRFGKAFLGAAVAALVIGLSPRPAVAQSSGPFLKAVQTTRTSFCKSQGMLSCLRVDRAACEAKIGPAVNGCAKDPGPAIKSSQNENLIVGFLTGCTLTAFLAGNPYAKEAIACIQQAGKKK